MIDMHVVAVATTDQQGLLGLDIKTFSKRRRI